MMKTLMVILSLMVVLGGCANITVNLSPTGEISAASEGKSIKSAQGIVKDMKGAMQQACDPLKLTIPKYSGPRSDLLEGMTVSDFLDLVKKHLPSHNITLNGYCT